MSPMPRPLTIAALESTDGGYVDLARKPGLVVVFVYPKTSPAGGSPEGWGEIPGARGCTAESCAFRDLDAEFKARGSQIFGLSTQTSSYQQEASARLHLSYPLLADPHQAMRDALGLETFTFKEAVLYRRTTLILQSGMLLHRFADISNPASHSQEVLEWVIANAEQENPA